MGFVRRAHINIGRYLYYLDLSLDTLKKRPQMIDLLYNIN